MILWFQQYLFCIPYISEWFLATLEYEVGGLEYQQRIGRIPHSISHY